MKHILYTEEEGGDFHYVGYNDDKQTEEEFEKIIKTGMLIKSKGIGGHMTHVRPSYVVLVEDKKDFDFVTKSSRIK